MRQILNGQVVDGHLGGYVPGGDVNTTYPALWEWLVKVGNIESVLDVGCGDGRGALTAFRDLGCTVYGIDGIAQPDPDVIQHDFTRGPMPTDRRAPARVDLVWSCEFVEHVEERYLPNVMSALAVGACVAMTHAVPGQGGYHHVNLRTSDYWIGALAAIGYALDRSLTTITRELAYDSPGDYPFFAHTGLVFTRA